jgi:hypothetical protein
MTHFLIEAAMMLAGGWVVARVQYKRGWLDRDVAYDESQMDAVRKRLLDFPSAWIFK